MSSKNTQADFKLTNPVHFLALGFGSGLIKPAPGTWGTLAAVPLYYLAMQTAASQLTWYLLLTAIICIIGVYLCGKTADDVGVHDHSAIVWDEIAGFFITMILVQFSWQTLLAGFVLFRFFDILKPWPIKVIDRSVHGGFGIMLDDILAGIFACGCLHLLLFYGVIG